MVQKSHPTTAIVEWLLFCAPYRQGIISADEANQRKVQLSMSPEDSELLRELY